MPLPNFLVIGAAKAGTSSLFSYLGQHPDVFISGTKEPNYFAVAGTHVNFTGPGDRIINETSVTDLRLYEGLFRSARGEAAIGEASTLYLYLPTAPPRIRQMQPGMRLIAILREPAERAYSSYLHMARDGREPVASFEDALKEEDARVEANWEPLWHYTRLGFYYGQLKRYYDLFPPEQIRVCLYDDFERNPGDVVRSLFSFLGVDPSFEPDMSVRHKVAGTPRSAALHALLSQPNPAKSVAKRLLPNALRGRLYAALMRSNIVPHKEELCPETRDALRRLYAADVERLACLIRRDLSEWLPAGRDGRPA
jgi:hypothetical protein